MSEHMPYRCVVCGGPLHAGHCAESTAPTPADVPGQGVGGCQEHGYLSLQPGLPPMDTVCVQPYGHDGWHKAAHQRDSGPEITWEGI